MKTTIDRVPKSLSEYLSEMAKAERRTKTELYKEIEDNLKGRPTQRRKDDKPPFAF